MRGLERGTRVALLGIVFALAAGCVQTPAAIDPAGAPEPVADAIPQPASLVGTVFDDAGLPIEGAAVALVGTDLESTTDAEGSFLLEGLAPGDYVVRIDHPSFAVLESPVEAEAGTVLFRSFSLVPEMSVGPGYRPHVHDLWAGRSEVTVIDEAFEWHESYSSSGPASKAYDEAFGRASQPVFNGCVAEDGHVYFNNRPLWFHDPAQLVWQGTSKILLTVDWGQDDAGFDEVALAWRTATNATFVQGGLFGKGETFTIEVGPEDWDSSHQTFTLWEFWLCVSDDAIGIGEEGRSFVGTADVTMRLVRGHEIAPEPAHPRFWQNGTRVDVIPTAARSFTETSTLSRGPRTDSKFVLRPEAPNLVPPGTRSLRIDLNWTYDSPLSGLPAWSLTYRSADVAPNEVREPGQLARPAPVDQRADGRTYLVELPASQTDAFYQKRSNWLFLLNLEGQEDDWKWTNPCGCHIEVRAHVSALMDPGFE